MTFPDLPTERVVHWRREDGWWVKYTPLGEVPWFIGNWMTQAFLAWPDRDPNPFPRIRLFRRSRK